MKFIHDDADFAVLIQTVADARRIAAALVEKDYWVTHTLWALHQTGLEIWFKGGTALSKGYGIIERFSEDVDLCIKSGNVENLPAVTSWTSANNGPIASRVAFYTQLLDVLTIPGARVVIAPGGIDSRGRSAAYFVEYAGHFTGALPATMRPHVLIEVGDARVTPFVERRISSFVHDWLEAEGQLNGFMDNRPMGVRCLHPAAVLVEKLDAIRRRYHRTPIVAREFIRHYEDAARIVLRLQQGEHGGIDVRAMMAEMVTMKQIAGPLAASDAAFALDDGAARTELETAHAAIAPMFWGPRLSLAESCRLIREWLKGRTFVAARNTSRN